MGSTAGAIVVLIAHYGGALLNGIFFGAFRKAGKTTILNAKKAGQKRGTFADSVFAGFEAMGMILSYLMFFMIGINVMEYLGIFSVFANETVSAFIKGLLEMTAGSAMIGACNATLHMKAILTAVIVSFGGLSVACQATFMVREQGITLVDVVKMKIMHGLFAGILAIIISEIML